MHILSASILHSQCMPSWPFSLPSNLLPLQSAFTCAVANMSSAKKHALTVELLWPLQVHWHRSLDEVPDDLPTVYIAHEFLDALPVHQFQKTERGWCERLIDIASDDSPLHFRLVLSPRPTPASKLLVDRRLGALPFDQSRPAAGSLLES